MDLNDRVIIITGGGSGIGAGMARRFAAESPRGLVVADIDLDAARAVADEIGAVAVKTDVSDAEANGDLIEGTEDDPLFAAAKGFYELLKAGHASADVAQMANTQAEDSELDDVPYEG